MYAQLEIYFVCLQNLMSGIVYFITRMYVSHLQVNPRNGVGISRTANSSISSKFL